MIDISNSGPRINDGHIADIEVVLGNKLPATYRDFLLRHNGGLPTPDTVDIALLPGSPTDIQVFFGVGREVKSSDLSWNIRLLNERLSTRRYLPVACDSGGGVFCLDFLGASSGEVVYLDLRRGADALAYPVAATFDAFLGKIREWRLPSDTPGGQRRRSP